MQAATSMYIATGSISSYYIELEGADAETYLAMAKQEPATSKYDELWHSALEGNVLTDAEDIQRITFMKDAKIKLTFKLDGDKLAISEYELNYSEWGTGDTMKELYAIALQEGTVKTYNKYRNGELQAYDSGDGVLKDNGTPVA